jgi:uncharacterized protein
MMERVDAILSHPLFLERLGRTAELEKGRAFCRHGLDHLLDVARIAYTLHLEAADDSEFRIPNSEFTRELVYAAALLHDIGRARQYEDGTPHEEESARIAAEVLPGCGFDGPEAALILDAVLSHRSNSGGGKPGLAGLLYRADKLSRRCFDCAAIADCDWELKNLRLGY